ncbi:hypothetical protein ACFSSA_12275 [Luteolibacter algae]|uniref:PEP-CTERM sorting domain-containing protein n=1 Tax=Luteolibacter algae TaxID=454151 RepID=A0ABW5DCQ0_9BACT
MKYEILRLFSASTLLVCSASAASIITDGDFSSNTIDGGDNFLAFSQIDGGWVAKNGWNTSSGAAVNVNGWQGGEYGGLSQVVSVSGLTGTALQLSLNFTPPATVSDPVSLQLTYQIIGWTLNTSGVLPTDPATAQVFKGQNYPSFTIGNMGGFAKWDDLLIAGNQAAAGEFSASAGTFTGVAGETGSFSITTPELDLSSYDYIGIRLATVSRGSSVDVIQ